MRFIAKSISRKLFLTLFLFALLVGGGAAFYFKDSGQVSLNTVFIALGLFLLLFVLFYYLHVVRPLKVVLSQMQALISGKQYKRIFTTRIDEVGILAHFFNQVTKSVGEVSHTLKDRERMLEELTVASQLQRDILPLKIPSIPGLQIVAKNKPASELGGDSFNVFEIKGKTYFYIGDVTGHGVAAGLIMTMVSSLVSVFSDTYDSPYDILVQVNHYIKKHIKKAMFMTMVMLCWDQKAKKMTYVGAGHEYILVYRVESGECEAILSGGVALGMVPDNSKIISEKEIELNDGDFIVLYTDGITEARNGNDELYGLDALKAAVKEYAPQYSAEGVNYHIAKDVSDFMQGQKQLDDMTLIVVKRTVKEKPEEKVSDQTTSWVN